jgi:hypothetical protein
MWFIGALNAVLGLAAVRQLFGHLKTPPGANRLIVGRMATISPTLNLWDGIPSSPSRADERMKSDELDPKHPF